MSSACLSCSIAAISSRLLVEHGERVARDRDRSRTEGITAPGWGRKGTTGSAHVGINQNCSSATSGLKSKRCQGGEHASRDKASFLNLTGCALCPIASVARLQTAHVNRKPSPVAALCV